MNNRDMMGIWRKITNNLIFGRVWEGGIPPTVNFDSEHDDNPGGFRGNCHIFRRFTWFMDMSLKPCTSIETCNTICIFVIRGGVGVRWGGANNVHVNLNTHGLYGVHVGVGRAITFMSTWTLAHIRHARLWHLLLHLNTYVMHSLGSSLALAHIRHATSCAHTSWNDQWNRKLTTQHNILKLHANVSFSCSKWSTTSDAFRNSGIQKLVSDILIYTSGKARNNVSLQTYVKLKNKDAKTAWNWLFQTHSKTNEPKQVKHTHTSCPEHKSRAGFCGRAP